MNPDPNQPIDGHSCACLPESQLKLIYLEEDDLYQESYFYALCCGTVWFQQVVSYKETAAWERVEGSRVCEELGLEFRESADFSKWAQSLKEPIYRHTLP